MVIHITERMGIKVQSQHSVICGVLNTIGDAISGFKKKRIGTCVEQHCYETKDKSAINEHVSTFQLEGVLLGEFEDNDTQTVHGVWAQLLSTPPLFPWKNKNNRQTVVTT